jgi:hypothetical protein
MKISPAEAKKDIKKLFILSYMSLGLLILLLVMFYEDLTKLDIGDIYINDVLKLIEFGIYI